MKYTASQGILSSPIFLIEPAPVTSLWYFLHAIPDHRRAQGKRHQLPTVLILAILAIASGAASYQAISEWALNYQEILKQDVSFIAFHTPDKTTYHRVFARLNVEAFEDALGSWLQTITHTEMEKSGWKQKKLETSGSFIIMDMVVLVLLSRGVVPEKL